MSYTGIFDSHAHYNDSKFDADRDEVLRALPASGVFGVLNCGTGLKTSLECVALADKYPYLYAAAGLHPEDISDDPDKNDLEINEIYSCLLEPRRVVAVGEIGLDRHWRKDNTPEQKRVFARQLALSRDTDLPVIIHDREAHSETLELCKKYRPRGVMHSFSGSVELMEEYIALGMYIGIGGSLTYPFAKKTPAVAAAVPADRLLLETDAPYSAPEPHRGERNVSAYIALVAQRIAELKNTDAQSVIDAARENAAALFGIGGGTCA